MLCRPCIVEVRILQGGGSVVVSWAWSDGVATGDGYSTMSLGKGSSTLGLRALRTMNAA